MYTYVYRNKLQFRIYLLISISLKVTTTLKSDIREFVVLFARINDPESTRSPNYFLSLFFLKLMRTTVSTSPLPDSIFLKSIKEKLEKTISTLKSHAWSTSNNTGDCLGSLQSRRSSAISH